MNASRDQLIEYLLRFWYKDPGKCMNREWIENHANEILKVLNMQDHLHVPETVGVFIHTHDHKPTKNYNEMDIGYNNGIGGEDWIRCYHPDQGWVIHSTKYHAV